MATNFPSSLDSATQQPSPASGDAMNAAGKEHHTVHTNHSTALIALETKVGTGDSNATANAVLIGTGSGTSGWDTSPTFKGAVTVGVDDTGYDVKFFGATSGKYMEWDESADSLIVKDTVDAVNFKVNGGQGSDGQVLTSTGSGVAWEDAGGGGGGLPTGLTMSDTAGFTVAPSDVGSNTSGSYPYSALQIKGQTSLGGGKSATIHFLDKDGAFCGMLGFQGQSSMYLRQHLSSHFYIQQNVSTKMIALHDVMYVYSDRLQPTVSNAKDLGTSSLLWRDAYVVNGVTTTSDVNEKKEIKDTTLGLDFINALRPVEYKWKDGGVRKHQGFIAQEVKTVLDAKDSASDQGMWGLNTVKSPKTIIVHHDENDEDKTFDEEIDTVPRESLRYNELIGPLVKAVQELTTQNEALTARITILEG